MDPPTWVASIKGVIHIFRKNHESTNMDLLFTNHFEQQKDYFISLQEKSDELIQPISICTYYLHRWGCEPILLKIDTLQDPFSSSLGFQYSTNLQRSSLSSLYLSRCKCSDQVITHILELLFHNFIACLESTKLLINKFSSLLRSLRFLFQINGKGQRLQNTNKTTLWMKIQKYNY